MKLKAQKSFFWKVAALLILTAVIGSGVWVSLASPSSAPETTFHLIDNQELSLRELKGRVVVLNFWATDCVSCIAEMPMLSQIYQDYNAQGLDLIAIALARDHPKKVAKFTQSRSLPFKVAYDGTGEIANLWGPIQVTPTTLIIDRKGRVVHEFVGAITEQQLKDAIEMHL